jgi:hypothetical protein
MSFDQSHHFFHITMLENMLPLVSYHSSNTEGKNFTKINKDPP